MSVCVPRPEDVAVRGGTGGIAVNLAELTRLAGGLESAAAAVRRAARNLDLASAELVAAPLPGTGSGLRAAAALAASAAFLTRLAERVTGTAESVRRARQHYAEAEDGVRSLGDRLVRSLLTPASLLLPGPQRLLFERLPPDLGLRPLGWALAAVPGAGVGVLLRSGPERTLEPDERPRGTADLVAGIDSLYPRAGGTPGSFAVDRVDHADGRRSWVVLLPGTERLGPGANPLDLATNLQAFAGAASASGVAVLAGLAAAGARKGEPVLIAGHSQGGLVAMRLAADARVREAYSVRAVLTAGSPVGHVPSAPGVTSLHLEHSTDVVPALDGSPNPDEADRITVQRPLGGSLGEAHDTRGYATTAALADEVSDPSLEQWRGVAGTVLGDGSATTTRTVYTAERL